VKKWIPVLLLALALIAALSACSQPATSKTTAATTAAVAGVQLDQQGYFNLLNGKSMAMIYRNTDAANNQRALESYFKKAFNLDLKMTGIVYVDSLTDGLLMLRSHKVAAFDISRMAGLYLMQRNSDLKMYINDVWGHSYVMIFNLDKKAQLDKVNAAIQAMKDDGKLDELVSRWITNLPPGEEPSAGPMPVIEGAETLKMGISGDEPPLDYIAADGKPGGFNVAVMSEISRRTNLNFSLVAVNSGVRFAAMQSGKIDSFLWNEPLQKVENFTLDPSESARAAGTNLFLATDSYLTGRGGMMVLK
jgi:ABC-type amino acid transport substrate-binding protein